MQLDAPEADLLRGLIRELRDLLTDDSPGEDPVVDRLFPDAYESRADADAFRDMVGDDLRREKLNALEEVWTSLGNQGHATIPLAPEVTGPWLTTLTDLRLAIGTRIGVSEDMMSQDLDADQPTPSSMLILHWLGWVQESMLEAIQ